MSYLPYKIVEVVSRKERESQIPLVPPIPGETKFQLKELMANQGDVNPRPSLIGSVLLRRPLFLPDSSLPPQSCAFRPALQMIHFSPSAPASPAREITAAPGDGESWGPC